MSAVVFFFGVWPYVALAVFVVGHVWRYRRDQPGWTSRTSQVLEGRWLAWGSPLFHYGALVVILGHAVGLLVPEGFTKAFGVSEGLYHATALAAGLTSGTVMLVGLALLLVRRHRFGPRLRFVTTWVDWVVYVLLAVIAVLGACATVGQNLLAGGYNYRETVSPWLRSLFIFHPDVDRMAGVPLLFQVHVAVAFCLIAIWPFTRLVHVWSVPLGYLARPYVVYRAAGTGTRPAVTRAPWV